MDDARLQAIKARVDAVPWNTGIGCSLDGIKYYAHGRSDDEDRALIVTLENIKTDVPDLIAALEASRAECAQLRAQLDDAMETLKPFARVSELGWSAYSDRLQVVILSEGDICQAWQMIHVGSRWHPVALNGAADTTVGEP